MATINIGKLIEAVQTKFDGRTLPELLSHASRLLELNNITTSMSLYCYARLFREAVEGELLGSIEVKTEPMNHSDWPERGRLLDELHGDQLEPTIAHLLRATARGMDDDAPLRESVLNRANRLTDAIRDFVNSCLKREAKPAEPKPWNWREHWEDRNLGGLKVFDVIQLSDGRLVSITHENTKAFLHGPNGALWNCDSGHGCDLVPVTPPERWEPLTAVYALDEIGQEIGNRHNGIQWWIRGVTSEGVLLAGNREPVACETLTPVTFQSLLDNYCFVGKDPGTIGRKVKT